MLKNFSPKSLGINGRQSELIELALTYGFLSMDIDMYEILRRSQRTSSDEAAKFLLAAMGEGIGRLEQIGGFELEIDLDADDDSFTSQVGALHPLTELAAELGVKRAYITLPASTDRLPYHEFFQTQTQRIGQIADVLATKGIKLGVGFDATKELAESLQFDFVRNVEGLIAMVKGIGNENVGFVLDTWDWVVGDGAMDQLAEIQGSDVVAIRMASLADDADPSKATRADRVLPTAEGTLNHVEFLKQLISTGFDGPVCPAASPSRYKGQTRESTVKEAQEAIDAISTGAGIEVRPLPMDTIDEEAIVETTPAV